MCLFRIVFFKFGLLLFHSDRFSESEKECLSSRMFSRNHQPLPSPLVFGGVAARFVVHCCDKRMALNTFSRKSHFQLVPRAEMRSHLIKDAYDLLYSVEECCSHITPRAAVYLKHAKQIARLSVISAGLLKVTNRISP